MDPAIQAFNDKLAEKAAAKQVVLKELGDAIAAGQSADSVSWATVEAKQAELQAIADKFVKDHPELFAHLDSLATPEGQVKLVGLVQTMRKAGLYDEATVAAMFEMAKFERQQIGVQQQGTLRLLGGKS